MYLSSRALALSLYPMVFLTYNPRVGLRELEAVVVMAFIGVLLCAAALTYFFGRLSRSATSSRILTPLQLRAAILPLETHGHLT